MMPGQCGAMIMEGWASGPLVTLDTTIARMVSYGRGISIMGLDYVNSAPTLSAALDRADKFQDAHWSNVFRLMQRGSWAEAVV